MNWIKRWLKRRRKKKCGSDVLTAEMRTFYSQELIKDCSPDIVNEYFDGQRRDEDDGNKKDCSGTSESPIPEQSKEGTL